jgi:hypothetical protein
MVKLAVVPSDQVVSHGDVFRCVPYRAHITAEVCVRRQEAAKAPPTRGVARDMRHCLDCSVGRSIAERIAGTEDQSEPLIVAPAADPKELARVSTARQHAERDRHDEDLAARIGTRGAETPRRDEPRDEPRDEDDDEESDENGFYAWLVRKPADRVVREMTHERIVVDKDTALALLEANTQNRPISQDRVRAMAHEMKAGRWLETHQGIGIDRNGAIVDGQHRLWAISDADVAIPMLIVRGLDPESRAVVDTGRARSVADSLKIVDAVAHANRIVPALRSIALLEMGRPQPISFGNARQYLSRFHSSVEWFTANGPKRRPLNRAAICGALLYAHKVMPDVVAAFTAGYVTGAALEQGSPVLRLRELVLNAANGPREHERLVMLKALRAIAAFADGEQLELLKATEASFERFQRAHKGL